VIAVNNRSARRVADIACGTGILADRIARQLRPDEIYGVDMSDGMLAQARARSSKVQWREGPAEHLPFEDGTLDAFGPDHVRREALAVHLGLRAAR